jgi:hypothetical protein
MVTPPAARRLADDTSPGRRLARTVACACDSVSHGRTRAVLVQAGKLTGGTGLDLIPTTLRER